MIIGPAVFDRYILPLDVASFGEALPERIGEGHIPCSCRAVEKPNHRHWRLLRTGRKRPRGRTAECGQQFPPSDGGCHTPPPPAVRRGRYHATSAQSSRSRRAGCWLLSSGFGVESGKAQFSALPPKTDKLPDVLEPLAAPAGTDAGGADAEAGAASVSASMRHLYTAQVP